MERNVGKLDLKRTTWWDVTARCFLENFCRKIFKECYMKCNLLYAQLDKKLWTKLMICNKIIGHKEDV